MKKLVPGIILFAIFFSGAIALQVGADTLRSKNEAKSKSLSQKEEFEAILSKLSFQTINGKKMKAVDIKSSVVLVNFWASWCLPCLEEMPSLVNLKKKFGEKELTIISFNTDENNQLKNITKTLKKFNITNEFEVVADDNTKIADMFKFSAIPVTLIFRKGKLVEFINGPADFNSVEFSDKMKKWVQ